MKKKHLDQHLLEDSVTQNAGEKISKTRKLLLVWSKIPNAITEEMNFKTLAFLENQTTFYTNTGLKGQGKAYSRCTANGLYKIYKIFTWKVIAKNAIKTG